METIFLKMLNLGFAACWLAAAILLLRLVLRKAPRWVFCLLWGLVALRLVCPVTFEAAWGLLPSAETVPPAIIYEQEPHINSGVGVIDGLVNPLLAAALAPQSPANSVNPIQIWLFVLEWVWAIGAAALLLYAAVSCLLLHRRLATATKYGENARQSERVDSPFVLGIPRPVIYLPYGLPEADLAQVLAHERAHIQRRDHWWKPLGYLLLAVYWVHPLLWAAYAAFCRDVEMACDEKVIAGMDADGRRAYSAALLRCSVPRRRAAACPLAFGEVGVKARIQNVMACPPPSRRRAVVSLALGLAVAVCLLAAAPGSTIRNPWMREYQPGQPGSLGSVDKAAFESRSADFAIGADRYGRAVFKDPRRAWDAFTVLYADGIEELRRAWGLAAISPETCGWYKLYGAQTESRDPALREQFLFISAFLDIYENSYAAQPPAPGPSATTEPYTG